MYLLLLFFVVLINFILGLFVLSKNYRSHINISFSIFVFAVVLWMLSNHFSNQQYGYDLDFLINKLIFFTSLYIAFGLLYFSAVFPQSIIKVTPLRLLLLFLPIAISNCLVVANHVITGIMYLPSGATGVEFGWGISLWTGTFIGYVLLSFGILFVKLRRYQSVERVQIQYLLLGIFIFLFSAIVTNLLIPLLFNSFWITTYGPFFTVVTVAFTTYAIVRHRFLDIRFVVARTVAYVLLVTIFAVFYATGLFVVGSILLPGVVTNVNQIIISIALSLVIAATFEPLRHYLEKVSDKFFYQQKYDSQNLLQHLGKVISSNIELSEMSKKVFADLIESMKFSAGALLLIHNDSVQWEKVFGEKDELVLQNKKELVELINNVGSRKGEDIMVFSELPEGNEKNVLRESGIELLLSLVVNNQVIGGIALSPKAGGGVYSSTDIKVLKIISPELAVAVKNALSFEEIKEFNITLKEKVDEATRDLRVANSRLEELDKLKDEFVSIASHELRTPLTVIRSYVSLLLGDKNLKVNDKQKEYLQRAYSSTNRLNYLVDDMLNISRIESGRFNLTLKEIHLGPLIEEMIVEIQPQAQKEGIELSLEPHQGMLPSVKADVDKLKEVLINFIGNGIKYTPKGGSVIVRIFQKNGDVVCEVKDTGIGIKKEDISKLFTKFGSLEKTMPLHEDNRSTGLGLYLSKSIIELHGGKVWAESEGENKGSSFFFSLKAL